MRSSAAREAISTDYRMVRPDGRIVWIRDRAYAFRDDDGTVLWEHGLLFDVTELKEAEARVAHLAYHDSLTGLANRQLFEETLSMAMERARRALQVVAVLYFDLDNFKHVNDSFGHHTGDTLLVQLADRLRACTRDTDLVARQGGDEFLMLLGDLAPRPPTRRSAGWPRGSTAMSGRSICTVGRSTLEGPPASACIPGTPSTADDAPQRRHGDVPGEADGSRRLLLVRSRR